MVSIVLTRTETPSNYVQKKWSQPVVRNGFFRSAVDVVNPIITIEGTSDVDSLLEKNYARIEEFGRNYFVTKCVVDTSNLITFYLHCDVLSTYWNDSLRFSRCVAGRSSNKFQTDLVDEQMWFTADSLYSVISFPKSPFSGDPARPYVLTVAGSE